jgi:hypothetical protein
MSCLDGQNTVNCVKKQLNCRALQKRKSEREVKREVLSIEDSKGKPGQRVLDAYSHPPAKPTIIKFAMECVQTEPIGSPIAVSKSTDFPNYITRKYDHRIQLKQGLERHTRKRLSCWYNGPNAPTLEQSLKLTSLLYLKNSSKFNILCFLVGHPTPLSFCGWSS